MEQNINIIRAGIQPKSRIERANRKNNPKYKLIFSAETDSLSEYIPSPKQRALTEYELISAIVGDSKEAEKIQNKSNQIANISVIKSNNKAKQFGAEKCLSFSKISKIVGGQFVSLGDKFQKIQQKQNVFDYVKPETPPNHQKNLEFYVEKQKELQTKKQQLIKEKGNLIFQQITREKRNLLQGQQIPVKFSNDSGLGDYELQMYKNKNKKSIYISKISRQQSFYDQQEQKKIQEENSHIINLQIQKQKELEISQNQQKIIKKVENHKLLSRKSDNFWDELDITYKNLKQLQKETILQHKESPTSQHQNVKIYQQKRQIQSGHTMYRQNTLNIPNDQLNFKQSQVLSNENDTISTNQYSNKKMQSTIIMSQDQLMQNQQSQLQNSQEKSNIENDINFNQKGKQRHLKSAIQNPKYFTAFIPQDIPQTDKQEMIKTQLNLINKIKMNLLNERSKFSPKIIKNKFIRSQTQIKQLNIARKFNNFSNNKQSGDLIDKNQENGKSQLSIKIMKKQNSSSDFNRVSQQKLNKILTQQALQSESGASKTFNIFQMNDNASIAYNDQTEVANII